MTSILTPAKFAKDTLQHCVAMTNGTYFAKYLQIFNGFHLTEYVSHHLETFARVFTPHLRFKSPFLHHIPKEDPMNGS